MWPSRDETTQTKDVDQMQQNNAADGVQANTGDTALNAVPRLSAMTPVRDKWYQRTIDGLRSWVNRHRYLFEVALHVTIFLLNRVSIGISLRPDNNR